MNLVPPVDRDRQRGEVLDRSRARQRADVDRPQAGQQLDQLRCLGGATRRSRRTRTRRSRAASSPAPSRCAGMVLKAPASRTPSGSSARTCSDADPSATSTIAILPPVNVTGTVTSMTTIAGLKCGRNSSSSGSTELNGTASTTTSALLDRGRVGGRFDRSRRSPIRQRPHAARSGSREPTIDPRAGARKPLRQAAALLSGAAEDRDADHGL